MMTEQQRDVVKNSRWIQEKKQNDLRLHTCKLRHEILERIFLNVSASYGVTCRSVMKAKRDDGELYSYLCICILLIDEYLFKVFKLTELERENLLKEWFFVLADYYDVK
jgi:hypothetical protein